MWEHLRAWRRTLGQTLQSVASVIGVTHSTLLRYERGEIKVPPDVLRQLAQMYGCTPVELQFAPSDRQKGLRLHRAPELLQGNHPARPTSF
jgi:transcriptional regulator with XRE-family HTH domain